MTDHQIRFTTLEIKTLLAERKSQARVKFVPLPPFDIGDDISIELATGSIKPRYAIGDRLWVREAFSGPYGLSSAPPSAWPDSWCPDDVIWYWADGNPEQGDWTKPKPSIHMPRWASRLTLAVTDVRVERLGDIGEVDCIAEGVLIETTSIGPLGPSPHKKFLDLWTSIHGAESWDPNLWVTAISFEVHHCNIDALPAVPAQERVGV